MVLTALSGSSIWIELETLPPPLHTHQVWTRKASFYLALSIDGGVLDVDTCTHLLLVTRSPSSSELIDNELLGLFCCQR